MNSSYLKEITPKSFNFSRVLTSLVLGIVFLFSITINVVAQEAKIKQIKDLLELSKSNQKISPREGLEQAEDALQLSEAIKDTNLILASVIQKANHQRLLGIKKVALKSSLQSKKLLENVTDEEIKARYYLSSGHIYVVNGMYQEALVCYGISLEYYAKTNDSLNISYTYTGLGGVYLHNKKTSVALLNYKNALEFLSSEGDGKKSDLWVNVGICYGLMKDWDNSEKYYFKALDVFLKNGWKQNAIITYDNLGAMYLSKGDFDKALQAHKNSLKLAEETKLNYDIMRGYRGVYEVLRASGDTKNALMYFEKYHALRDDLDLNKNNKEAKELELKYSKKVQESRIIEQELELAKAKKKVLKKEMESSVLWIVISFLLLFAIGSVLFYRSINFKNKQLTSQKGIIENSRKITEKALAEKETLLKEIHHRVKNNLQIILSLISLHSHQIQDKKASGILQEVKNRIQSIALIHKKIYQSKDLDRVDFLGYISDLVKEQEVVFQSDKFTVASKINCEGLNFNIDTAIPLGLIISELVTNAYKYAFAEVGKGILEITITPKGQDSFLLTVKDNGAGIPFGKGDAKTSDSIGLMIVETLAEQLQGSYEFHNDNGAVMEVSFKEI